MFDKIELFKTRIFYEDKTYLLVSDAAKVLGYVSTADFMNIICDASGDTK